MRNLTTNEAAERLGVTVRRVHDLITSGRLPAADGHLRPPSRKKRGKQGERAKG